MEWLAVGGCIEGLEGKEVRMACRPWMMHKHKHWSELFMKRKNGHRIPNSDRVSEQREPRDPEIQHFLIQSNQDDDMI